MTCRGGWVLEVDIRKFFDNLDHDYLRSFLRLRVRVGVLLRLIDKWLKAGVMEDGSVRYPDAGTLQGGVISPLLSNVFLDYMLDLWFEQDVKLPMRRRAFLIRYADDFVMGFRDQRDAQRVRDVVPKRFSKYGLTVHPTKTKLVPFRPPSSTEDSTGTPEDRLGTFDLLGFAFKASSIVSEWDFRIRSRTATHSLLQSPPASNAVAGVLLFPSPSEIDGFQIWLT